MAQIVYNITLVKDQFKEEEDIIIIPRVTEKEIEEAFPEIIRAKILLRREKRKRDRKYTPAC